MTDSTCAATGQVLVWLKLEGLVVLLLSLLLYGSSGASWWLFAGLLLSPDIAMLGYLRSARIGAITYNVAHTYVVPLTITAVLFLTGRLPRSASLLSGWHTLAWTAPWVMG